ncbi:MAG: hypothetical protein J6Y01_04895 [Spirochaetales bacterium]|nr:hypothetical protein [Spirochaetales bacterium]
MKKKFIAVIFLLALLIIYGCKSSSDVVEPITPPENIPTDVTEDITEPEPIVTTTTTTTTIQLKIDDRLKWSASEKVSTQTLERNIRNLFITIEEKIAHKDFDGWYGAISDSYRTFLNDKVNLQKMSQKSPYLHNKGIILQTPQDYFIHVVIPAREGNKLEYRGYKKIDNNNIRVLNGIPGFSDNYSYNFIYQNGSWHLDR